MRVLMSPRGLALLTALSLVPASAWAQQIELPAPGDTADGTDDDRGGVRPYIGAELGVGSASLTLGRADNYDDPSDVELSGRGALWGVAAGVIVGTPRLGVSFGLLRREFSTVLECDDCEKANWTQSGTGVQVALRSSYFFAGLNVQDVEGVLELQLPGYYDGEISYEGTRSKTLGVGLDFGMLYRIKHVALGGTFSVLSANDGDADLDNTTVALTATTQLIF